MCYLLYFKLSVSIENIGKFRDHKEMHPYTIHTLDFLFSCASSQKLAGVPGLSSIVQDILDLPLQNIADCNLDII